MDKCPEIYFTLKRITNQDEWCNEDVKRNLICSDANHCLTNRTDDKCLHEYFISRPILQRCIPVFSNLTINNIMEFVSAEFPVGEYFINFGLKYVSNVSNVSI